MIFWLFSKLVGGKGRRKFLFKVPIVIFDGIIKSLNLAHSELLRSHHL